MSRRPPGIPSEHDAKFASGLRGRSGIFFATLFTSIAMLCLAAPLAFAERTYDSQISGLINPWGVTIDPLTMSGSASPSLVMA